VDNLLSADKCNIPNSTQVSFIEGSITQDWVLRQLPKNLDYVFHLATYHGNQNSMADPLADHENNTYTTLRLYEHLKDYEQLKKVVYSSAGCTVAEKTYGPAKATTEEDPVSLWLDTPYQMSKIFGEFYSNYYFKQHKLRVVKARFQNVYGPGEILGAGQWRGTSATVWRNVIPTFVYRALKHMPLRLDNGGVASRDFIFARDIARGLMCCAANGSAGEAYNLASGAETSILDLAHAINRLAENPTPLELAPMRAWDRSGRRYGATQKAKEQICFEAVVGLEEGLKLTVDWTRDNLALIEKCISKHQTHMAAAA
jgi:nucleoside-diphosphate-sugar epimerase